MEFRPIEFTKTSEISIYLYGFQGFGVLTHPMLHGESKLPENRVCSKIKVKEICCLQVRNTERCYSSGGETALAVSPGLKPRTAGLQAHPFQRKGRAMFA